MKEIIARFKNESPSFFKKIQIWMVSLGGTGLAIVALPTQIPQVTFPPEFITLGYHLITIGAVGAILSKLPVSDPSVLTPKQNSDSKPTEENPAN